MKQAARRASSWGDSAAASAGAPLRGAWRTERATGSLRIGEWTFSPQSGRLWRDGEARHLGPRQVELLRYLSAHAGEVVSKQEVLDAVWAHTIVEEGAVHRCISEIRKALGDDAHEPAYVLTVPKRGYLLVAEVSPEPEAPRAGPPVKRGPLGWPAVAGLAMFFALGWWFSAWHRVPLRRPGPNGPRPGVA